jgi:broad specificity phosphatase PhoE
VATTSTIPAPPKGFALEDEGAIPAPPKGFALDSDSAQPAAPVTLNQRRPSWSGDMPPAAAPVPSFWKRGAGVVAGALSGDAGYESGTPVAQTPAVKTTTGLEHLTTPGERVRGGLELANVAGEAAAPIVGPAALEAGAGIEEAPTVGSALYKAATSPMVKGLVEGTAASKVAEKGAQALGARPEVQQEASNLGWLLPMLLRSGLRPEVQTGHNVETGNPAGQVTMRGGIGGGIEITPTEVILKGGTTANPKEIRIPRTPQRGPLATQGPTIEGQTVPPPTGVPPTPPAGPGAQSAGAAPAPMHEITAQDIAEVGDVIAKLPQEMRAQATLETHTQLAGLLLQQGKFVGPDGKVQIISNQKQAESLAQKYINEEIGRRDAEAKKAANEPVPAPPAGFTIDQTPQAAPAAAATTEEGPRFAKGDRVVLPDGREGTIAHAHPRMNITRVVTDAGERVSIGAAKLKAAGAPAPGLGNAAGPSTPAPGVESQNEIPSSAAAGPATQPQGENSAGARNAGEPARPAGVVAAPHATAAEASAANGPGGAENAVEQTAKSEASKGDIIFARHGETKLDQAGANETVAGWTDEPLDDRGKAAAAKLAEQLKDAGATTIVTSDLPRAKQTAEIVGKQLGIPVTEDSRLRPQHVPETEGLKVGEATPIWNSYEETPDKKPEGGESWNEARTRQDAALKDVNAMVAKGEKPIVVTHSRNLEMELGERPKPGGFITKGLGEKGGTNQPAKVESANGNREPLAAAAAKPTGEAVRVPVESHGKEGTGLQGPGARENEQLPGGVPVGRGAGGHEPQRAGETAEAAPPKYKFGSTQANIPAESEASKALESARARISDSDLAGKGKEIGEGGNHITVRYGIKGEDTAGIKKFLSEQTPFEATLGKTEKFPVSEHSEGAAPIIAPIVAPELHRLNAELEKHGEFEKPSFKEYKPHATIAYVDPEKADRYVGMDVTAGKKFTVDEVAITDKQGEQEVVKLEGKKPEPRRAKEEIDHDINELTDRAAARQKAAKDESIRGLRPAAVDWMDENELRRLHELQLERHPYTAEEMSPELAKKRVEEKRAARREAWRSPRVAADIEKWQAPPELGVTHAPDYGQKVRADTERRMGGPLTRSSAEVAPGKVGEMKVSDLKVAPNKFQYKLSTDAEGVGTLLKETKVWNPDLAGIISVWRDPADGKTYVVNGHHRYELAKRLGVKAVTVRHIVASSAKVARAIGAEQNIAEGRGTAMDAGKFFRDSGITPNDLSEKGISLSEGMVSKGMALANLSEPIFNRVVQGDLTQGRAITIGESTSDPAEQKAVLDLVERKERAGKKVSDDTLSELIRLVKSSGQTTETTSNLFGTQEINRSLALEKAEISAHIKQQLAKDKKLFGFVSKGDRASELERGGNKIDVEQSQQISTSAAQAEEVYNLLSARGGPIANILDEAARGLADGENAATVKSDAYRRIRAEVSQTLGGGEGRSAERHEGTPEAQPDTGTSLFSPETELKPPELAPPFYSKAARVAFDKLPSSGSGQSILATLKNAGVKDDEIKWIGLDDFLKGRIKVSKADVLGYIMKNMVQVREVTKGAGNTERLDELNDQRESIIADLTYNQGYGVDQRGDHYDVALTDNGGNESWVKYGSERYNALPQAVRDKLDSLSTIDRAMRLEHQRNQNKTKYDSYTLPGDKRNYTELLLTLPQKKGTPPALLNELPEGYELGTDPSKRETGGLYHVLPPGQIHARPFAGSHPTEKQATDAALKVLNSNRYYEWEASNERNKFTTSHFEEPNILAHVRFDERTDADGKPILFVEEVQSDWHQKGKKVGYRDTNLGTNHALAKEKAESAWQELKPLLAKADNLGYDHLGSLRTDIANGDISSDNVRDETPELRNALDRYHDAFQAMVRINTSSSGVPNAPFKSDWHELAMKTMLRKAAEGGYDKIGWVTGEQTADRYDISKQIESINYDPDNQRLVAKLPSGSRHIDKQVPPDQLPDYIGKEAAQRLLATEKNGAGNHELHGTGLKVGGEWAKALYDRAIPNFLSKYGKKWGAKVGDTTLQGDTGKWEKKTETGWESTATPGARSTKPETIHSLAITPEMRASVLSEGQPLFSAASEPVDPATAKGAEFEVKATSEGLPSYLRLNSDAAEAINRALGVRLNGVNIDAGMVPEVATKLKADGDRLGGAAKATLYKLADAMLEHSDREFGLSVIRAGADESRELATLHEEMLHSTQRKAGKGDLAAGTPWKAALQDEGIVKMAADRIIPGLVENGLKPRAEVVVAEAMVDLLRGDAGWNLKPEQIEESSQKYFEAMAAQSGIESVEAVQRVQDYIARLKQEKGISYGEGAERARAAGQRGLTKTLEGLRAGRDAGGRGGEVAPSSKAVPGKTDRGEPGGSTTPSLADATRPAGESWRSRNPARKAPANLHSTQPIGLSDEELEDWSKSKGFRVEPAGEQLGMFGANEPVMRVFRSGPRGKEQKGLVYQSQLDQLKQPKPEPTEPFALTGGESREEQPRLFGAGDMGEIIGSGKSGGIQLPGREKPTSLFSSERGEAKPGELARTVAEAAGTVGDYLREAKRATDHARNLQRGLETLDTAKQADILRGVHVMKSMKTAGMTKADDAAVYHHLENPEGVKLQGKQDQWLDDVILPIQAQNEDLYTELTDGGVPIENYVHRVVKGKGGMLDRIAQGAKGVGGKGSLSKSAPQTKSRTYMALEDREGKRMVVSVKGGQVTAWDHGTPENLGGLSKTEEGTVFEDKDGDLWTLKQATTKEIEAHTETEYYHSALASSIASNIQLNSAVRAMRFLEAYKASPEFKEIAWKGPGNPPAGWHPTKLPQFPGYYFEPRTAEVLDDYYDRMRNGQFGVLQSIQKFLRAAYLMNPIVHPLNVAASWGFEKGLTGFAPWKWKSVYKSGSKAVKAVLEKNQDFLDALDAGAALQSHREELQDIHKLFFDRLAEGLDQKESWAMDVARSLGIEHGNLLNLLHKPSSMAAWFSSDVMYLQAAYQYQMEHPGVELSDALKEAGRIIPEYRVPARMFDSRVLSKAMTNPLISWFGAYHYGLLKSFAEAGKAALGAQKPTEGRTKAEEVAKGWDRLAMLGLITMVLYPLLDQLAKKATGDEHARVRRSGPAGYVDAAEQVAEGKQDASSAAQKVLTPSPITKGAIETFFNRDLFSGHEIRDPHADWQTQLSQVGRYLMGDFGIPGQLSNAETSEQKKRFAWQQAGIQFAKTRAEKVAGDIAASKVGTEAESPEDHANRVERREILDQLRQGNRKPLEDAEGKHELTHRQILSLEHRARLQPLEDTVANFTVEETERVLKAARADKDQKEISLLENILHKKILRANAGGARYSWQRELAGASR